MERGYIYISCKISFVGETTVEERGDLGEHIGSRDSRVDSIHEEEVVTVEGVAVEVEGMVVMGNMRN